MNDHEAPKRTAAATAALMRRREEKAADLLVERGWTVTTPEGYDWQDVVRSREGYAAREAVESGT